MTVDDIHRIAELARLSFTDEQATEFAVQFADIVEYVGTIDRADLGDAAPLLAVNAHTNRLRDDVVGESLSTAEALANAPQKNEAFFKVPRVL